MNRSRWIPQIAAAVAIGSAGFWMGKRQGSESLEAESLPTAGIQDHTRHGANVLSEPAQADPASGSAPTLSPPIDWANTPASPPPVDPERVRASESPLAMLARAVQASAIEHAPETLDMIASGMSLEDVYNGIESLGAMATGPAQRRMEMALLRRWAQLDPLRAMDYSRQVEEPLLRHQLKSSVVQAWAAHEPMQAFAYAQMNPEGDLGGGMMREVFEGAARAAPADALLFAEQLDPQKYRGQIQEIVYDLFERSPDEVVRWTERLEEGPLRDSALHRVIDHWARYDPIAAKNWMEHQIRDDFRTTANIELGESWARVNPQEATQWFSGLPEDQQKPVIMERIFKRWLEFEPETATVWLEKQQPSPYLDSAKEQYIRTMVGRDPQNAAAWAASMTDERKRQQSLTGVAWQWVRREPKAALTFMQEAGLNESQLRRLTHHVNSELEKRDGNHQ